MGIVVCRKFVTWDIDFFFFFFFIFFFFYIYIENMNFGMEFILGYEILLTGLI